MPRKSRSVACNCSSSCLRRSMTVITVSTASSPRYMSRLVDIEDAAAEAGRDGARNRQCRDQAALHLIAVRLRLALGHPIGDVAHGKTHAARVAIPAA